MARKKNNKCSVKGCNGEHYITYYSYPICKKHFFKHCEQPFLKKHLNIPQNNENTLKTNLYAFGTIQ